MVILILIYITECFNLTSFVNLFLGELLLVWIVPKILVLSLAPKETTKLFDGNLNQIWKDTPS